MSEQQEQEQEPDPGGSPAKVVWSAGLGYENDGLPCEVHCRLLDDNGVCWVFKRAGREFPVRLSHTAMECVFELWQRALWQAPAPLPKQESVPTTGKP